MNILPLTLILESTQPRDVAKAMLKFWLYQSQEARRSHSACAAKVIHCQMANERAAREWQESDDCLGFSGPPKPFSDSEIQLEERRLPMLKQALDEAEAMAGYMVNFITDKAHPEN